MFAENLAVSPQKILVVDDEAVIRDMMVDILDIEGYAIDTARNGSEALEKLRGLERYLVFLDLMMPVMSGLDLCAELNKEPLLRQRHVLVVMSALDQLAQVTKLGIDATLPKPFVVDDVMHIIDTFM